MFPALCSVSHCLKLLHTKRYELRSQLLLCIKCYLYSTPFALENPSKPIIRDGLGRTRWDNLVPHFLRYLHLDLHASASQGPDRRYFQLLDCVTV